MNFVVKCALFLILTLPSLIQVVSLTKHRSLSKPDDEQLHVLPLYIMDDSDEHGSKEDQAAKEKIGAIETLTKYVLKLKVPPEYLF